VAAIIEQVNLTLRRADRHRAPEGCSITGLSADAAAMFGLPQPPAPPG
jgi:hypothetical protein